MNDRLVNRWALVGAVGLGVVLFLLSTGLGFFGGGVGFGETAVSVTAVDEEGAVGGANVTLLDGDGLVANGTTTYSGQVRLSGIENDGEDNEYELRIDTAEHGEWSDEMTLEDFENEHQGDSPGLVTSIINTVTRTTVYNLEIDISEAGMEDGQGAGDETETEDEPQPEFGIVEFDVPRNSETNAQSEVFVDVENTGDDPGVVFVDLSADERFVTEDSPEVQPGERELVTLEWTPGEAGEVELTVELTPEGADEPVATARETVEVTEGQG